MLGLRHAARILFQGDSITDGNRRRADDPNHILGHSYAFLIAAKYGAMLPERELTFLNRGISGNMIADLRCGRELFVLIEWGDRRRVEFL